MEKTLSYWIEKLRGIVIGVSVSFVAYIHWETLNFVGKTTFFDKLITICPTLFGFLLTVLTLIVQSDSTMITRMKEHGSYSRLIIFNKIIVFLSVIVSFISLFLYFTIDILKEMNCLLPKIVPILNLGLFVWLVADTLAFVHIFYKILLSDSKK